MTLTASTHCFLAAVAAMSNRPGSYRFLCEIEGRVMLTHQPVGTMLYEFNRPVIPDVFQSLNLRTEYNNEFGKGPPVGEPLMRRLVSPWTPA